MKKFILLFALVGLLTQHSIEVCAQPKLKIVEGLYWNWGDVKPAVLHHDFHIVNEGSDTLKISGVFPGCSCTTAPISKTQLLPGDTGVLSVSVDLVEKYGKETKPIIIASNDSSQKHTILVVDAYIKQGVSKEPPDIMVSQASVDSLIETEMSFTNHEDSTITVFAPSCAPNSGLSVGFADSTSRRVEPSEKVRYVVYIKPLKKGFVDNVIKVKTTSPFTPELSVKVYCNTN